MDPLSPDIVPVRDPEVQDLLALCYSDVAIFCKTFFPERFSLPFSPNHYKVIEALTNRDARGGKNKVVIAGHRHFGKSSLTHLALPAHAILYRYKKFIVPISYSATHSIALTEGLKRELRRNELVQRVFGEVKSTDEWTKLGWVTNSGTYVLPRGSGQQVRGLLYGPSRPDYILIDDLEDKKDMNNEQTRANTRDWFFSDVEKAVDMIGKDSLIVYIFNMIHHDCLGVHLMDDPTWFPITVEVCDEKLNSNWPEFKSTDVVKQDYEDHRKAGRLSVWFREWRCKAVSTDDLTFSPTYFQYYDEGDENLNQTCYNFVIVDPAKTSNINNAETAIVGVGVHKRDSMIFVRDIVSGHFRPDETIKEALSMVKRLGARHLAVEVTGIEEYISYPFRDAMIKEGMVALNFIELDARSGESEKAKEARVGSLCPFYRMGRVKHNRLVCASLEDQLISYPLPKKWDIMDAFSYIVQLLDKGMHWISKPYHGMDDKDETELTKKKMEELLKGMAKLPALEVGVEF